MKLLRLLFQRDLAAPISALMLASATVAGLVFTRIILVGDLEYGFLLWNLLLAWLPLIFALLLCEQLAKGECNRWRAASLSAAWLLFFPNAPYIFTDLIHLSTKLNGHYWADMILILLCALTGSMLGFVSLYLMQSVIARRFSQITGWLFVAGVAGLTGIGVFLGRFLRLNSWDVIWRPGKIFQHVDNWMADPFANAAPYLFPALFAVFLFVAYLMFYTLTRLPAVEKLSEPQQNQ